jgi:hypothetical protein
MKKKVNHKIRYLIIFLIIIISLGALAFLKFTGFAIKNEIITLHFSDVETNCSLNGYLFIDNKLIGKTNNGLFDLTLNEYKTSLENKPNQNISLFGKLGDCFKENNNMLFDKSWKIPEINNNFFYGETNFNFKTNINIHNPKDRELIGFIQPENVKSFLGNLELNYNIENDLSKINFYLSNKINYINNSKGIYWQLPVETLLANRGICNDYSTTLLSLFLAYNPSLKCYNIILSDHVTTICNINNDYIYYDQQEKEVIIKINNSENITEIKSKLSDFNNQFLDVYGLDKTEIAKIAFNDKEFIEFKNNQDFIDWQYSLINKDTKTNILSELEKESTVLEENQISEANTQEITNNTLAELGSQKPNTSANLPTLSGFFTNNIYIIIGAIIIIIALLILLYRINKKK